MSGALNSSAVPGLHSYFPSTADKRKNVSAKPSSASSVDIPSLRFISVSIPHHFCSGPMLDEVKKRHITLGIMGPDAALAFCWHLNRLHRLVFAVVAAGSKGTSFKTALQLAQIFPFGVLASRVCPYCYNTGYSSPGTRCSYCRSGER
jgi:hypothetical protein